MSAASLAMVADVGESFGNWLLGDDEALLDVLTNANVACGFHAGDPLVMDRTIRWCVEKGVEIGAHPGFRDLVGFGRRDMDVTAEELRTDVLYQIGALSAFVRTRGGKLSHLTPHGRLGNRCVVDEMFAHTVADAVAGYDPGLIVVTQEGALARAARENGLTVGILFLSDREYEDDGQLVSRRLPGAVIEDPAVVAERTIRMAEEGTVVSVHGTELEVASDVVLLHGDNPAALANGRRLRAALEDAGVAIKPLSAVLAERAATVG